MNRCQTHRNHNMNNLSFIILTVVAFLISAPENVAAASPPVTLDPFAPSAPQPHIEEPAQDPVGITIIYEAFSLPIAQASELQRKGMNASDLYKELIASSKLEKLLTLKTSPGQRARLDNGSEYIYTTEFGPPPGMPTAIGSPPTPGPTVTVPAPKIKILPIPFTPTAFTNRLMGDSIALDAVLNKSKTVSMVISVSHVRLVRRDKWGKGIQEQKQPLFENRSLNTKVTATHSTPVFIGTLSPVFGNGVADRKEQDVWFAFITARLSTEKPVKLDNAKAKP